MKYKNILVGILLVLVTTTIVFGNNNISLNNSLVNETIIDQVNIIEKVDSVEVDPIEIIEKSNFFVLSNNLIESSKVKEISPIELKEKSIKNKVKNGFKQKVEDLNIDSKLIGCSLSTNLVCELEMDHNYKVYFMTNDGEKLYPQSYEKNDNNYMITFDTKKEGVLHVGRHSDQYLIKNNFLFYSPSKVSKNVEFHGGVKGSGNLEGIYDFYGSNYHSENFDISNDNTYSISFWINPKRLDLTQRWIGNELGAFDSGTVNVRNDHLGQIRLTCGASNYITGGSAHLDKWTHYILVSDGSKCTLYENNVQELQVSGTASNPKNGLYLGGYYTATGTEYFYGSMKDVRVFDFDLSSIQREQVFNNESVAGATFELEPNYPAINFDGVNDYLAVPHLDDLNVGSSDFTIYTWFKTDQTSNSLVGRGLIGKGATGSGGKRFGLAYITDSTGSREGEITFDIDDNTVAKNIGSQAIYNDNKWHLAVGVREGSFIRLYIDGVEVPNSPLNIGSYGSLDNTQELRLGKALDQSTNWMYDGSISSSGIYKKALTQSEINSLYLQGLNSPVDEEASFYLDGKQLIDWSNTGYNLGAHNGVKITDLKEVIYEDPKDSDLTSWSSSGEGTIQKTAGVIKASSYGSGSSWHGPTVEKNIEVIDGQTLSIKNTFTTTNDQMGKTVITLYDDAGDSWVLSLTDAWASELAIQTSVMNDVGANLYTNKDSGNSGHEFLWDVEVSNGEISFYIDNNLLTTDQMTGTKITSIKISMPAFSTYSISKAEINSIEIKKPNGGKAFNFDGVNDYFDLNRKISGNSQFSISTWYKLDADANGNQMIYEDSNTRLRLNPTGTSILIWKDRSATGSFDYIEGYIPKVNEYTHLTLVVDGDNYKLYENGVEQSTTVSTSTTSSTSKNANIGRSADGNSYFKGSLVNFMMFNKPLTETEVTDLFTKGKEYDPSTIDNNILNETEARGAILEELDTSLGVYTYKEDRQVTVRLANGSQYHGRYDMYVSSGDKRYVINYDENETAVQPVVEGISPVLNVWQRVAKKASDFKDDLREFIGLNN